MIFFQNKKFTACKIKDEKEEIILKVSILKVKKASETWLQHTRRFGMLLIGLSKNSSL